MKEDLFSGKSDKSTSYYFKKLIVESKPTHYNIYNEKRLICIGLKTRRQHEINCTIIYCIFNSGGGTIDHPTKVGQLDKTSGIIDFK